MKKNSRIFVLCYPHLGTLDNWMPIINSVNNEENHLRFTLIVPNPIIIRSFHGDNAVIKIANRIFDTILIHAYDGTWIKHESIFDSMKWYQKNRVILRLFDIMKRLIKKRIFSYLSMFPFVLLRNIIYKKECKLENKELNKIVSQKDVLFYDIATEGNTNPEISSMIGLFENNNKYSLPHAVTTSGIEWKSTRLINIKSKDNIRAYVHAKFQVKRYEGSYGIDTNKIHVIGVPRHDRKWIETIQDESPKLPDFFNNNNTIVILSSHINASAPKESFLSKVEAVTNIKKIFIDKLGMKVAIKLHPNEKQEKIFADKSDKIYEDVLGLNNYGVTWVYSDLHVLALIKGKRLAISLFTGVIFDVIAMGIPCVEYVDLSFKPKNTEKKLTEFVKHGFIEGVSNYHEINTYAEKWGVGADQISKVSINAYKKYFPIF